MFSSRDGVRWPLEPPPDLRQSSWFQILSQREQEASGAKSGQPVEIRQCKSGLLQFDSCSFINNCSLQLQYIVAGNHRQTMLVLVLVVLVLTSNSCLAGGLCRLCASFDCGMIDEALRETAWHGWTSRRPSHVWRTVRLIRRRGYGFGMTATTPQQ